MLGIVWVWFGESGDSALGRRGRADNRAAPISDCPAVDPRCPRIDRPAPAVPEVIEPARRSHGSMERAGWGGADRGDGWRPCYAPQ
jgi:hypothetical protein